MALDECFRIGERIAESVCRQLDPGSRVDVPAIFRMIVAKVAEVLEQQPVQASRFAEHRPEPVMSGPCAARNCPEIGTDHHGIDDESIFAELQAKWKADTKLLSNVTKRSLHPAYQRIIGMGESSVPLILRDLQLNGPDDWFWALTAITGENPITDEIAGDMTAMTRAWIQWGTAAGYLKDSPKKSKKSSRTSSRSATE